MNAPEGLNFSNWREHPFSQWSFQHVSEVVPSATIPACTEMEQNHRQASETKLFIETTLPSSSETLQSFLSRTYADGFMVGHKGSVVASWYAPHFDPTNTHIVFSVSKSITVLSQEFCNIKDCLIPNHLYRTIFPFRLNRPIPTVLSSMCWT